MPSISTAPSEELFEPSESFTVINYDNLPSLGDGLPPSDRRAFNTPGDNLNKPLKNVNIVKPVIRTRDPEPKEARNEYSFRVVSIPPEDDENQQGGQDKRRKRKTSDISVHSQTILDPHFSRHLDLKLRRLKEKEIIAERLSRRSRERQRAVMAESAAVIPKVSVRTLQNQPKNLSVSQSNLTTIKPNVINLEMSNKFGSEKQLNGDIDAEDKLNGFVSRSKRGGRSNFAIANDRPLFITTVKKGEFLPPPASMATLLGLSSCERIGAGAPTLIYSYASRPKVVGASTAARNTVTAPEVSAAKGALAALASLAVAAAGLPSRAAQSNVSYGNLMTDRRIVRGSTSNYHGAGLEDGDDSGAAVARGVRAAAARRRAVARRRGPGAPGILPGAIARRNEPVQTEPYLEELYDKGREMEIGIQTDMMLERVETPIYIPAKSGCDVETQIVPGELFDFETEVEPVLEVLVGKTIEQALAECLEEEELAHLRKQATATTELRAQAAASARHRQRHLMRILNDKERRIEDEDEANEQLQSEQRTAALALVKAHLPPLLPAVLGSLRDQGYLADTNPEIDETFLPWLMSEVTQEVESMITNREVLMDIVKEVIETRAELYRAMGDDEAAEISSSTMSTHTSDVSQKNDDGQTDDIENLEEVE